MFCFLAGRYETGASFVVLVVFASCKVNHYMRPLVVQICVPEQGIIRESAETVKDNCASDDGPEFVCPDFVDFLTGRCENLLE